MKTPRESSSNASMKVYKLASTLVVTEAPFLGVFAYLDRHLCDCRRLSKDPIAD